MLCCYQVAAVLEWRPEPVHWGNRSEPDVFSRSVRNEDDTAEAEAHYPTAQEIYPHLLESLKDLAKAAQSEQVSPKSDLMKRKPTESLGCRHAPEPGKPGHRLEPRSEPVEPTDICFIEQATSAFQVTWPLFMSLWVPFGSLNGEEITAIDV